MTKGLDAGAIAIAEIEIQKLLLFSKLTVRAALSESIPCWLNGTLPGESVKPVAANRATGKQKDNITSKTARQR